jgi:hypothetical protein
MLIDELFMIMLIHPSKSCMLAWALEAIIFLSITTKSSDSSATSNSCYSVFKRSLKIASQEVIDKLCLENYVYKDRDGDLKANFQFIENQLNEKGWSLRKHIGEYDYARHVVNSTTY